MKTYRTEVEITADRRLEIQLPATLPTGRASVSVMLQPRSAERLQLLESWLADPQRLEEEWWTQLQHDL